MSCSISLGFFFTLKCFENKIHSGNIIYWDMIIAVLCLVAKLCLTLCSPMDCSLPGSSVYGILQARILEWVAMPSSRGSSLPGIEPRSRIAGGDFTVWATREACLSGHRFSNPSHQAVRTHRKRTWQPAPSQEPWEAAGLEVDSPALVEPPRWPWVDAVTCCPAESRSDCIFVNKWKDHCCLSH